MGEPGGLSSMGLHGVGHNWSDLAAAAAAAGEAWDISPTPSAKRGYMGKMAVYVSGRRLSADIDFQPQKLRDISVV